MSARKAFTWRIVPKTMEATHRWPNDNLRSLNALIESVLREALRKAGRLPKPPRDK